MNDDAKRRLEDFERSDGEILDLSNLNLSYIELPGYFTHLDRLRTLDLGNNMLTYLPENIGSFTKLSCIDLTDNQITSLPGSLGQLTELQSLYLSANQLNSLPRNICRLTQLRYLYLRGNKLRTLPANFNKLAQLVSLDLSDNQLDTLPDNLGELRQLRYLDLSANQLISVPDNLGQLNEFRTLNLSGNRITSLPDSIGQLRWLGILHLSNNRLSTLPESIGKLPRLETLNLQDNRFEIQPEMFSRDVSPKLKIDYRGNPFYEKGLSLSQRVIKIWQNVPPHLRDILTVYLSGFKIFYTHKTQKTIRLDILNTDDGLTLDVLPELDTDPEQLEALLHEYYEILKNKIQEGAQNGAVYPNSGNDSGDLYAQIQASNFAQGALLIKQTIAKHVSDKEILLTTTQHLDSMENDLHRAAHFIRNQSRELQQQKTLNAHLGGKSEALLDEVYHRRLEAQTRASQTQIISINQQISIAQQTSSDFGNLRELLYNELTEFQRDEAARLQKDIDKAAATSTTADEKRAIGTALKRWLESVKGTLKNASTFSETANNMGKYLGKLKEFADAVINDPKVVDTIEHLKRMIEATA